MSLGISNMGPNVPSLPPEILREIIQLVPHQPFHLISLWLDVRNVNYFFRDLVENLFISDHLERTRLECRVGKYRAVLLPAEFMNMYDLS